MITISGLSKCFENERGKITIFHGVDITLPRSGMCFFVGKSGSGKSTFLNILGGLLKDYSGKICLDNDDIAHFSEKQWDEYRNTKMGFVFQNYGLFENRSVLNNVLLPTIVTNRDEKVAKKEAETLLSFVGLKGYENVSVSQLSGGEKQRVAIARALINHPKYLFADEPTGNLDTETSTGIYELLKRISKDCLVCIVSHDQSSADKYGDSVFEVSKGEIRKIRHKDTAEVPSYRVSYLSGDGEIVLSDLSLPDLLKNVSKAIENHDGRMLLSIERVDADNKSRVVDTVESPVNPTYYVRRKLTAQEAARLAISKSKLSWMKTLFGTLLMTILLVFTCAFMNLYKYKPAKVIAAYLKESNVPYIRVFKEYEYIDSQGEKRLRTVSSGKVFMQELPTLFEEAHVVPLLRTSYITQELSDEVTDVQANPIQTAVIESLLPGMELEGEFPKTEGEIAIPKDLARYMQITDPVGKMVIFGEEPMRVSGVYSYQYENKHNEALDYNVYDKEAFFKYSDSVFLREQNIDVAVVNAEHYCASRFLTKTLELEYANFAYGDWETYYFASDAVSIGCTDSVSALNLLEGRLPSDSKEIMIGRMFADLFFTESPLGKNYYYLPIHDDRFGGYYSDYLDMSELFPEGVKVVGIYDEIVYENDSINELPNMLFKDESFRLIKNEQFSEYCYGDNLFFFERQLSEEDIQSILSAGVSIRDPNVKRILDFRERLDSLSVYIITALLAMIAGIFFVAMLIVNASIKERYYTLGMMRSIGFSMSDISKMLYIEAMGIGVTAVGLATVLFLGIEKYANGDYLRGIVFNPFDILVLGPGYTTFVAFLGLGICFVAASVPIFMLRRKEPIELLRGGS